MKCGECYWWNEIESKLEWGKCCISPPEVFQTDRGGYDTVLPETYVDDFCSCFEARHCDDDIDDDIESPLLDIVSEGYNPDKSGGIFSYWRVTCKEAAAALARLRLRRPK